MSNTSDAFVVAAKAALSFLEGEYGFTLTEIVAPAGPRTYHSFYSVVYRRHLPPAEDLFVCLLTAPGHLDQDLVIGHGWPREYLNSISVYELQEIESPDSEIAFTSGFHKGFGDAQKMFEQYTALASVLRVHGGRFFANDPSLWDVVDQLRESRNQEHDNEETSRIAALAFKQNDWQQAIALLDSLGDNLTKLQVARLAYARKHAAK